FVARFLPLAFFFPALTGLAAAGLLIRAMV
ncbi:MAG: hypothetical protein ACI9US_003452, partial [Gammaproteobacteria bacterium]